MNDFNAHALREYQALVDQQDRASAHKEACQKRAAKYFAEKLASINGENMAVWMFSLGGGSRYSFAELLFDYLGTNCALDAKFAAMLKTKEGQEFLDEFAGLLGDKHDEVGEIGDDYCI